MGTSGEATVLDTDMGTIGERPRRFGANESSNRDIPSFRATVFGFASAKKLEYGEEVFLKVWSLRPEKEGMCWLVQGYVTGNTLRLLLNETTGGILIQSTMEETDEESLYYFYIPTRYFLKGNVYRKIGA